MAREMYVSKEGNGVDGREALSCQQSDTTTEDASSPVVRGDMRGTEEFCWSHLGSTEEKLFCKVLLR